MVPLPHQPSSIGGDDRQETKPSRAGHRKRRHARSYIEALLDHLPAPGDYFPQDERKKWLQMIELSFDLIYDDQPQPEATDEPGRLREHGG